MPALEVVNGIAVNPGTTITAITPNAGNTLTVRNASGGSPVSLLNAWAYTTTNLLMRVRSPLLHDQAQNDRLKPQASVPYPLLPNLCPQPLKPQDNLTVELTGGTSETDLAALLIYYADLPGAAARLHAPSEVQPLVKSITVVEVDVTSNATAGLYSPTVALNGSFDTLKRNEDYAILGYESPTIGGSIGITGPDTGNLRLGGPLLNIANFTRTWFVDISQAFNLPLIPVINSANVAGTLIDITAAAASTSFQLGIVLAELGNNTGLS